MPYSNGLIPRLYPQLIRITNIYNNINNITFNNNNTTNVMSECLMHMYLTICIDMLGIVGGIYYDFSGD